jgi:hypothetical protein
MLVRFRVAGAEVDTDVVVTGTSKVNSFATVVDASADVVSAASRVVVPGTGVVEVLVV